MKSFEDSVAKNLHEVHDQIAGSSLDAHTRLEDSFGETIERVKCGIEDGLVESPALDQAILSEIRVVDKRDGRASDEIIKRLDEGLPKGLDPDSFMLQLVVLGQGIRTNWKRLQPEDLDLMLDLRQKNVDAQVKALEVVRPRMLRIKNALLVHENLAEVIRSGPLVEDAM